MTPDVSTLNQQKHRLAMQVSALHSALEITRQIPGWLRMADSLQMYSPESVVMVLGEQLETVHHADIADFLMDSAAHRIHRFGAGPALPEMRREDIQKRIHYWLDNSPVPAAWSEAVRVEVRHHLSDIWADNPLEPRYPQNDIERLVYVEKAPWPIVLH